jgi:hypothetical protein
MPSMISIVDPAKDPKADTHHVAGSESASKAHGSKFRSSIRGDCAFSNITEKNVFYSVMLPVPGLSQALSPDPDTAAGLPPSRTPPYAYLPLPR